MTSNPRSIPAERLTDALRIIEDFARRNPRWKDRGGEEQDPWGAHAWLEWYRSTPHETKAEPKVGDAVDLLIPLNQGLNQPVDGWKISEIRRSTYVFLSHPNGSVITLLPGQFAVKTEAPRTRVHQNCPTCACQEPT